MSPHEADPNTVEVRKVRGAVPITRTQGLRIAAPRTATDDAVTAFFHQVVLLH